MHSTQYFICFRCSGYVIFYFNCKFTQMLREAINGAVSYRNGRTGKVIYRDRLAPWKCMSCKQVEWLRLWGVEQDSSCLALLIACHESVSHFVSAMNFALWAFCVLPFWQCFIYVQLFLYRIYNVHVCRVCSCRDLTYRVFIIHIILYIHYTIYIHTYTYKYQYLLNNLSIRSPSHQG